MNNRGFTLTELLLSIAILGLLSLFLFPAVNGIIEKNKQDNYNNMIESFKTAASSYVNDNKYDNTKILIDCSNNVVSQNIFLSTLINDGYLKVITPIKNPKNSVQVISHTSSYVKANFDCVKKTFTYSVDSNSIAIPPYNNSIIINGGDSSTSFRTVRLKLSSVGATEMCIYVLGSSSSSSSTCSWMSYRSSITRSFTVTSSSSDGNPSSTVRMYAKFKNSDGDISGSVSDSIRYIPSSVRINNGSTYTSSRDVTLRISAYGAEQMCVSESTSCSNWISYSTSKTFTLSSGTGTKKVYVKFKNDNGNTVTASDTIIYE